MRTRTDGFFHASVYVVRDSAAEFWHEEDLKNTVATDLGPATAP